MSRIYTLAELKNTLNPIFEQFGVKKAVLFGSYAKGLATPRSDVDLFIDSGLRGLCPQLFYYAAFLQFSTKRLATGRPVLYTIKL